MTKFGHGNLFFRFCLRLRRVIERALTITTRLSLIAQHSMWATFWYKRARHWFAETRIFIKLDKRCNIHLSDECVCVLAIKRKTRSALERHSIKCQLNIVVIVLQINLADSLIFEVLLLFQLNLICP
jgi:hypothetical protein